MEASGIGPGSRASGRRQVEQGRPQRRRTRVAAGRAVGPDDEAARRGRPGRRRPGVRIGRSRAGQVAEQRAVPGAQRRARDGAADLEDGLGDLDPARTGVGAVEDRPAAPHAVLVGQDLEPLVGALVPGVEDESVGVDDGRRPDVLGLRPERRAGRRARGAQDALGRVVVALALGRGLEPLALRRRRVVDEVRLDALELVEEPVHVDDEVLDHRQAGQRRDGDATPAELLDPQLAGQPVAAVDEHRVGAAHAVGARPAEGQASRPART